MTYVARIIDETQEFVIENREGRIIASRNFPTQRIPYPGREVMMAIPENLEAWQLIYNLAYDLDA